MAEREISRKFTAPSGLEFTVEASAVQGVRMGNRAVASIQWTEGNVLFAPRAKGGTEYTLIELEDITAEMHRIQDALDPHTDDLYFTDRRPSDVAKPAASE